MNLRSLLILISLTAASASFAAPQLIARVVPGTNLAALAAKYQVTYREAAPNGAPFVLYELKVWQVADTVQAKMMLDPAVVWVEDNADMGSTGPGGSKGSTQPTLFKPRGTGSGAVNYGAVNLGMLNQIKWNSVQANKVGRPVKIAILDTGLSNRQPKLWTSVVGSYNAVEPGLPAYDLPRNTDSDKNGKMDESTGHGTMVAGLVNLVAPKTSLVIARVADSDGLGSAWSVTKGLCFAVAQGAEVANLSMGSRAKLPAISDVLDWATEEKGLLVVACIGNDNARVAHFPSTMSKVLCVAGVAPNNKKALFSNWRGDADACAPATGIQAPWWDGTSAIWEGTSFATPLVAGCLADTLRMTAKKTPKAMIEAVNKSGTSIDSLNPNYKKELGTLLNHGNLLSRLK